MMPSRGARWRGRALLFDLFGTVVLFAPRVPGVQTRGPAWRAAMNWLREAAERELPQIAFEDFLPALMQVTEEIVRQRPPEYREVPSRERFRRALVLLGLNGADNAGIAERLSLAHMAGLASMTLLPPAHAELLHALAPRYRLGLVSNFDHGDTARRILSTHGIAELFATVVISDDFGRRKPHPSIFAAALERLDVGGDQTLFIGDSPSDDLVGAHHACLPVVWLNAKSEQLAAGIPAPSYTIPQLADLMDIVSVD
jgi:HAD superfamily hydrolase (TIGR01549 family)